MTYARNFLLYWACILVYICIASVITKERITKAFIRYIPLAVLFHLIYWLINLRIAIDKDNSFSVGGRYIYAVYAKLYFIIIISFFIVFITRIMKDAFKESISLSITYLPFFLLFLYLLCSLYSYGHYALLYFSLVLFVSVYILKPEYTLVNKTIRRIKQFFDTLFRKESLIVITMFLIAFTARYLWSRRILSIHPGHAFLTASDDALTYGPYAADWAHGKIPGRGMGGLYWGGYGYWVFLGIIYKFFGDYNHHVTTFIQSILGALVPVCVFYIAKKTFNKYVSIIGGALTCLDMNLIFLSVVIGMEALWIPMVYVGLLMVILYFQAPKRIKTLYALAIGIFLGFANTVRGETLLLPSIIGILAILLLRKDIGTKKVSMAILALLIGFSLVLMLHATRNYVNYDKFTFSTDQAAQAFRLGYGADENKILDQMGFNPFSNFGKSITVFFAYPWFVSKTLAIGFCKRAFHFLTVPNFGVFDPIIIIKYSYPAWGHPYAYSAYLLVYGCLLFLGGFILAFRNREKIFEKALLSCYLLYTISIYGLIMSTNARHRGVLNPIFYLFFAYGLYRTYLFIKAKLYSKKVH